MRWFLAILMIVFGSFLMALTIDQLGQLGNIVMKITGFLLFFFAGFVIRNKKEKHSSL